MINGRWGWMALATLLLAACGEKPQSSARKADVPSFQGTAQGVNTAYMAPGWKAGDAVAWEQQMRARSSGQNEYSRAGTP
jgi:outer membrane biogenesis lipoprotein LolB